jgi:hypothetical protein
MYVPTCDVSPDLLALSASEAGHFAELICEYLASMYGNVINVSAQTPVAESYTLARGMPTPLQPRS